jgi:DNA recombination protein RmuC
VEIVFVVLLVILILVVGFVGLRLTAKPAAQVVPPVASAPSVDMAPIVDIIGTAVQGAVESKIREVATDVLTQANDEARKQSEERYTSQREALEAHTKNLMQPFAQQIHTLGQEVQKLHTHNTEKFGNVDEAVKGLATQTQALRNVLSSASSRGNWGERMLEDILSQSGFERGINYEKQEILGDGGKPDYSFYLPPDRVLYLDSKFPVDNYLKYFEASDDNSRNMYRDQFLKNVEDRIKELEKRDYVAQSNRNALDYVLLFIPNESVIGFIQQHKPSLIDAALGKKVVLCSPLTLYAFLGVVRQATDSFHMEQNAKEILGLLTKFSKAWTQYVKYLTDIAKHFDQIQTKLKAVTTGRVMSNLRKPIHDIEALTKAQGIESSDEALLSVQAAFNELGRAETELDDSAE